MVGGIKPLWPNSHPALDHSTTARHGVGDEANELVPIFEGLVGRLDVVKLGAPELFLLELFPLPQVRRESVVDVFAGCHLGQACGDLLPVNERLEVQAGPIVPS